MHIEKTRDKIVITGDEIEKIIKDHIFKETGRQIHEDVHISLNRLNQNRGGAVTIEAAYFWLEEAQ